jgi:hypothetical protein
MMGLEVWKTMTGVVTTDEIVVPNSAIIPQKEIEYPTGAVYATAQRLFSV